MIMKKPLAWLHYLKIKFINKLFSITSFEKIKCKCIYYVINNFITINDEQ